MNKKQLIESMAMEMETTQVVASGAVNAFIDIVEDVLSSGNPVQLPGFGTFSVSERAARKGRNPATGESIDIPARNVVKFKVGAKLKAAVN